MASQTATVFGLHQPNAGNDQHTDQQSATAKTCGAGRSCRTDCRRSQHDDMIADEIITPASVICRGNPQTCWRGSRDEHAEDIEVTPSISVRKAEHVFLPWVRNRSTTARPQSSFPAARREAGVSMILSRM